MVKTFVIDTNVPLNDPDVIFKLGDNDIVLPITVIEEVDRHKKDLGDTGYNARQFARNLKFVRKLGKISKGIDLPGGGTIRTEVAIDSIVQGLPIDLSERVADNRILAVAIACKGILITNDENLAIKAEACDVEAQEYQNDRVNIEKLYAGISDALTSEDVINRFYEEAVIDINEVEIVGEGPYPNQGFIVKNKNNPKHSALARYNAPLKQLELLPDGLKVLNLEPRSSEQEFALDALLNPDIDIVTIIGKAGSGKTLVSLAAALYGAWETDLYKKVLLLKPVVSMDNNHQLGFLPGTMEEKLAPWMASYYDNIDFIMDVNKEDQKPKPKVDNKKAPKSKSTKKLNKIAYDAYDRFDKDDFDEKSAGKVSMAQELISLNIIEIGSLEHIRGRSLPKQYIIIDEVQNLSTNSIKTIITRAGEGTKIVLLGDIEQIDAPYLDASSNGLTYVADKAKNYNRAAHFTLKKTERSDLAEWAANNL